MAMMNEENLSLEGLVKDLASTVKSLQEEVSELKKDKEERRALHDSRKNALVIMRTLRTRNPTLTLTALAMASPVRTKVCKATPRVIPPGRMPYQPRAKPSWRPPSAPSLIMQQGVNKWSKWAPQTLNGSRLRCFHQSWHPSFPRKW